MRVCPTERFAQQYVLPFCTGFLVQPDVVVTAGHCIASQLDCEKTSFVFDFGIYEGGSQAPTQISKSKVYSCKKLLGRALGGNTDPDWAVVQLDRLVCDRDALPLSQRKASSGNPLVLIGHPSGLPTKVADGANVRDLYTHFFDANLDSYGGNSGSPVFNANTGEIFGILVRGEKDFVDQGSCKVSNRCSNTGCFGEDVTYIEKVFNYTPQSRCMPSMNVVNGADYQPQVAPGGIATVFTRNLLGGSAEVFQSQGKPLPTDLKGVSVLVGNLPAGIFFVADSQINIQIPPTLGAGEQTVRILRNGQEMATGVAKVSWNAPALFTFGSRGEGGAALGQAVIIKGDSRQSIDLVDGSGAPNAIPVSQDGQSSIVVIYGTGIKSKNVHEYEVYINGVWSELKYSGPVSGSEETSPFVGLDQINVALPAGAANAGSVNLTIRHIPTGNTSKPIKINMGASI